MDIERMADQELEKLGAKKKEQPKQAQQELSWDGGHDYWWRKPVPKTTYHKTSTQYGSKIANLCKTSFDTETWVGEAQIRHSDLDRIVTCIRDEMMRVLDDSKVLVLNGREATNKLYMMIEDMILSDCQHFDGDEFRSIEAVEQLEEDK